MLEKEFEFFKSNHKMLFEKYPNRYLVIRGENIEGNYASFDEAIAFASSKFELGTFLIQLCTEGVEGYTQKFHSRVIFA